MDISLSHSTIVLYSRDDEGVGVVYKEKSTQIIFRNPSRPFHSIGQVCINKPKCVFRTTQYVSDEVLQNLKKNYFSEFSTASLPH